MIVARAHRQARTAPPHKVATPDEFGAAIAADASVNVTGDGSVMRRSRILLGLKNAPNNRIEVHHAAVGGKLTFKTVHSLMSNLTRMVADDVLPVLGISARTLRRSRKDPTKVLPPGLAGRAWLLAETLVKASEVLGGREQAETWMTKRAAGLDGLRPIDTLQTVQVAEIVGEFLTRLEYGVYS